MEEEKRGASSKKRKAAIPKLGPSPAKKGRILRSLLKPLSSKRTKSKSKSAMDKTVTRHLETIKTLAKDLADLEEHPTWDNIENLIETVIKPRLEVLKDPAEKLEDIDLVREHFLDSLHELQEIEDNFKNFDNQLLATFFKDTLERELQLARQENILRVLTVSHLAAAAYLNCTPDPAFLDNIHKTKVPERTLYSMSVQEEDREALFNEICERGIHGQWPRALSDCSEETQAEFQRVYKVDKQKTRICSTQVFKSCEPVFLKLKTEGNLDEVLQDLRRRAHSEVPDPFFMDCNPNISKEDAMELRKLESALITYKHRAHKDQCLDDIEKFCADLPST